MSARPWPFGDCDVDIARSGPASLCHGSVSRPRVQTWRGAAFSSLASKGTTTRSLKSRTFADQEQEHQEISRRHFDRKMNLSTLSVSGFQFTVLLFINFLKQKHILGLGLGGIEYYRSIHGQRLRSKIVMLGPCKACNDGGASCSGSRFKQVPQVSFCRHRNSFCHFAHATLRPRL